MLERLLERLRGKKRSPKEILQRHRLQTTYEPPIKPLAPPAKENSFVLDIKNSDDMNAYLSRLKNLTAFENFLSQSFRAAIQKRFIRPRARAKMNPFISLHSDEEKP